MKKFHLTPTNLRVMLSISLFAIIVIAGVVASLSYSALKKTAVEVSHTVLDANASSNNLRTLQLIQKELEENQEVVNRANSIVAESKSYQYQDQILADLNNYASKAGITITNIDFSSSTSTNNSPAPAPTAPTVPPPTGVKTTSVSVTLKNPIDYDALLRFLKSIEQNLTKMQISKIALAKDPSGGVTSEALTIEVYVR